jgi:hypothetical protein
MREKKEVFCGNEKCKTTNTPLWRKGWVDPDGKSIMLCNACGLHWKKGHFCQVCKQIYKESEGDDMENPWIGCDRCSRWSHLNCDTTKPEIADGDPYFCEACRENKDNPIDPNFLVIGLPPGQASKKKRKSGDAPMPKKKKGSGSDSERVSVPFLRHRESRGEEVYKEEEAEEWVIDFARVQEVFNKTYSKSDESLTKIGNLIDICMVELKSFDEEIQVDTPVDNTPIQLVL